MEPWMDFGDLSRGEFGLAMGIKQSHWPLWPLFHVDADPDAKPISLFVLGLGLWGCFIPLPEKKTLDSFVNHWIYFDAWTLSQMDGF